MEVAFIWPLRYLAIGNELMKTIDSSVDKDTVKSPSWLRMAQIGLGAIAVILSITIMANPGQAVVLMVFTASILLLIVGIERVITGLFVPRKDRSRLVTVGLGILVILIAATTMAFPVGTTVLLTFVLAVALLFDGISRIVHGIGDKQSKGWTKGLSIGVGGVEVALSGLIMVSPAFGAATVGFLIGIALLLVGIQIVVAGISGRKKSTEISYTRND
jgi:uncharacterized membrane protein HdeD (DUF308 family)